MKPELEKKLILPPKGARVLCAVSGGADSMCLLALLLQTGDHALAAAHFEHGIRGEESLRDCAFVESFCREKGVACFVGHADVPAYAAEKGLGLEEAARKLRYAFLEKTAEDEGFDFIATAHNAEDNAETVLFNLVRGTGPAGLCGIPPQRGRIVRPLLGLTRAEIEEYLAANGVPHVEDSTNADESFSRNRIRRSVMPVLKELNPSFPEAAARLGKLLRRDEDCLDAKAEAFISSRFDGESLPAAELSALHEAISSRVIRKLLPRNAEEKHIEAVLALCRSTERRELDLPGAHLRCERGKLYFSSDGETAAFPETELPIGGSVVLKEAGLTIRTRLVPAGEEIHSPFKTFRLKCESMNGKLTVAPPRPGERYRPAGRGCTKTLKSLFAEARATQREKLLTPVFRDETGVVLVPAFGEAERCSCRDGGAALLITIEEKNIDM